jgi:hypothetical protein
VIRPADFGADPTGQHDSSAAFRAVIAYVWAAGRVGSNSSFEHGLTDLGGVVIDLAGGTYMLDEPLLLPSQGGGNLNIQDGTLRAGKGFPGKVEPSKPSSHRPTAGRYLIEANATGTNLWHTFEVSANTHEPSFFFLSFSLCSMIVYPARLRTNARKSNEKGLFPTDALAAGHHDLECCV